MNQDLNHFDVIIAGAGPAGSSTAIYLANQGVSVLLAEQKKFPRPKLCGEFISPECWDHFRRLSVAEQMHASGGATLKKTVFYARGGNSVAVPSEWFGNGAKALGLSRSEMDNNLLRKARERGVTVLEGAHASGLVVREGVVRGVSLKTETEQRQYYAPITIDATGRARALTRRIQNLSPRKKGSLVAFKAHLRSAHVEEGVCEIYSYPGGYGGLNAVEGELFNLCFIVSAKDARRFNSDPMRLIQQVVSKNPRAAKTLKDAYAETPWLAVSLERFGREKLVPAPGLLTAGDAAAFIDPFTGSGMLMALESGELVANTILHHLENLHEQHSFNALAHEYRRSYAAKFESRLRVSGWFRRVALVPHLAEAVLLLFGNDWLRERLTHATRSGKNDPSDLPLDQKLST